MLFIGLSKYINYAIVIEHDDGDTNNHTTMLCACAPGLTKMATSSSARVDSISEFMPLKGAVSAVWRFFGFPARAGKILKPDK